MSSNHEERQPSFTCSGRLRGEQAGSIHGRDFKVSPNPKDMAQFLQTPSGYCWLLQLLGP
jgi:hypothetical protein